MAERIQQPQRQFAGCPFCGMVCDDLTIEAAGAGVRVTANGCAVSRRGFEALAAMDRAGPQDAEAAVARAAGILTAARAPVFAVAADVAGTRAALRLADRLGGVVDHPDSDGLFRNLRVQQDAGAFATTLSEVRNRADVVLVVGPDPAPVAPRFVERCIAPEHSLLGDAPLRRRLFRIGPPGTTPGTPAEPVPPGVSELTCAMTELPRAIAALSAALRGARSGGQALPSLDPAALAALVEALTSARYAVVVWAPALFPSPAGELAAQALLEIVRLLNRTTRAAALALGGGGNLFGVNQVCVWQTGYPLRTSFGGGAPEHDPYRFAARGMVARGEADALVWVSAFAAAMPPASDIPTIVLAPGLAPDAPAPTAFIPIGTPGIDHAGQVFRTDVVVALRLAALRQGGAPSAAQALAAIEARLGQEGAAR